MRAGRHSRRDGAHPGAARANHAAGNGDDEGRRRYRRKLAIDLLLWTGAGLVAFPLRVPRDIVALTPEALLYAALTIPVSLVILIRFRLAMQTYEQVSIGDLQRILAAVGLGTAIDTGIGFGLYALGWLFPRTVPLIQGLLAVAALSGVRLLARLRAEHVQAAEADHHTRVLLVGAGSAGARIAREIRRHRATGLDPVGYLDDALLKQGVTIAGLDVLGPIDDLPRVVRELGVTEVLLTLPSAPGALTRHVADLAREADVALKVLPGVEELLSGQIELAHFRPVQVEDLLRRAPVEFDEEAMSRYLRGQVVLVTGAGGSIGSELVRQVMRLEPRTLILMGQGENSLQRLVWELSGSRSDRRMPIVIGSVRDRDKVEDVMRTFAPDVVFHTAAHKHVPLLEANPDEAVLNNVGGTRVIAEAARDHGVGYFVNISTDKAVNPVSMLGVSKLLAEKVIGVVARDAAPGAVFVSVRFGNVLGSRGSVVPILEEEIRRGGPITITDPEMTRYFMTIPEASRLVIQAGALGENGGVYVLDMGTQLRIEDLAKDLIRLSGAEVDDIPIVYSGVRPGEKLHEELFAPGEHALETSHEHILMARVEDPHGDLFMTGVDLLLDAARRRDLTEMDRLLARLVPGFVRGTGAAIRPVASAG